MKRNRTFLALLMAGVLPAAFATPPAQNSASTGQAMQDTRTTSSTTTDMDEPEERGSNALQNDRAQSGTQGRGGEMAADHSMAARRALWTRLDTDHDGRISAAEGQVDTQFNTSFVTLDTDHDGYLSDSEYAAYNQKQSPTAHGDTPAKHK